MNLLLGGIFFVKLSPLFNTLLVAFFELLFKIIISKILEKSSGN